MKDFKTIFLTGHIQFREELIEQVKKLSLEGHNVIDMFIYYHFDENEVTEEQMRALAQLHKRKIELSDELFVFNKNNIIGELDQDIIKYAKKHNKLITYLEPIEEGEQE